MWDILGIKTLIIAFVVFAPLEHFFAMHAEKKILRPAVRLDLFYALFSSLITKGGLVLVIVGTSYLAALLLPPSLRAAVGGLPLWFQVVLAVLLSDLGFYAVHWTFHKVPWLWKFHAIHHSIETLDWLAGHRVHPVDQVLTKGASLVPVVALGFSDAAILIYGAFYAWQSLLLHSNVNVNLGPLRYIVALPHFHHWHHADHPEAHDKNFAGQLAFLDFIFGTYHLPEKAIPQRYGTSTPVPGDYVGQMMFPFRPDRSDQPAAASGAASAPADNLHGRIDDVAPAR